MDLGEKVFKWLHSSSRKYHDRAFAGRKVLDLEAGPYLERLEFVCRATGKGTVGLHLTDALDVPDRITLFVPRHIGLADNDETNFAVYLYRVLAYQGALDAGVTLGGVQATEAECVLQSALAAPAIHRVLTSSYSGFPELLSRVCEAASEAAETFVDFDPAFRPWIGLILRALSFESAPVSAGDSASLIKCWNREWMGSPYCPLLALSILPQAKLRGASENALPDGVPIDGGALPKASDKATKDVQVKTSANPKEKHLDDKNDNPLTHVFEKVLTAEEYRGGSKPQDGSDEIEEHSDALSELTLDRVIRTQRGADSVLRATVQIDSKTPDLTALEGTPIEKVYSYPEWFHESRRYKPGFCSVYESIAPYSTEGSGPESHVAHSRLSEKLSSFLNESRWKPRQKDGVDFDLDAVVRWRSQLGGTGPIDQRLYMGRQRLERNLAILILLDSSLSTDAWTQNRHTLGLLKSSVAILGDAFAGLDDRFAVATFNSYSRSRCNFRWIKMFEDDWAKGRKRLTGITPDGYTRIGPALRHAQFVMGEMRARSKLILLFSDSKPSDYDPYEGEHGIGDVRKAVAEIRAAGTFMKAITVAQQRRGLLTRMFGSSHFKIVSDPNSVADIVFDIFTGMMTRS